MAQPGEFPKYLMIIRGQKMFLSLIKAAEIYDEGFVPVEFGEYVLSSDFIPSELTDEHKTLIKNFGGKLHVKKSS